MPYERSAGVILFYKDDGEPLFLLLHYRGRYWGFPKGLIESGESVKEAAIREANEETGIETLLFIEDFKEKIEYSYKRSGTTIHKQVTYFLAETEQKTVKLSFEHSGYKWLNFNKTMNQIIYQNDRKILKKAYKVISVQ